MREWAAHHTSHPEVLIKLGTRVLKKIHKKIHSKASRQVQIDMAINKIGSSKWEPSKMSLREFIAFFRKLKPVLCNMPTKPLILYIAAGGFSNSPCPGQRHPLSANDGYHATLPDAGRWVHRPCWSDLNRNWYLPCNPSEKGKHYLWHSLW